MKKRTLNTQAVLIIATAAIILCLWIGSSAEGQRCPNEGVLIPQVWLPCVVQDYDPAVTPSATPTCRPTPTAQRPTPTPKCDRGDD